MAIGDGLVSIRPSSIEFSGTSATINSNDGVDFSAITSLSLNGIFSELYDNYRLVITHLHDSGNWWLDAKLRSSGVDTTGSDYVYQRIEANDSVISGGRLTGQSAGVIGVSSQVANGGDQVFFYGPYLTAPTTWRTVNVFGRDGVRVTDMVNSHSLSTSYDGLTFSVGGGSLSGTINIFGYEE